MDVRKTSVYFASMRDFLLPALMSEKREEEEVLIRAAIRQLKAKPLLEWEKDFIRNAERRRALTERQKEWLRRLKEKYLR